MTDAAGIACVNCADACGAALQPDPTSILPLRPFHVAQEGCLEGLDVDVQPLSGVENLLGHHLETFQDRQPKRRRHGDIGGVAAGRHENAPDARRIMTSVDRIPAAASDVSSFGPAGERVVVRVI